MQTILGANGQIAAELARELRRKYTSELRLVSRHPRKIDDADALVAADLLDAAQTAEAVKGSRVVYFTAGLPPDTRLWETQFPLMLKNAIDACRAAGAKFAYFDNTYMYPQDDRPTYKEFVAMACKAFGRDLAYTVIGKWALAAAGLFSSKVREIEELLPRYEHDNLFDSTKFKRRFPEFEVTTYRDGLERIRREAASR